MANRKRTYGIGLENVEPFACCQCGIDYTPVWKKNDVSVKNVNVNDSVNYNVNDKDNNSGEAVACEQCVKSAQKRALRIAHTNLLRDKFAEALKQEKEIERQLKDGNFLVFFLNLFLLKLLKFLFFICFLIYFF